MIKNEFQGWMCFWFLEGVSMWCLVGEWMAKAMVVMHNL